MKKTVSRSLSTALIVLCFGTFLLYAMYFNGFGSNASATMSFFGIDETGNGMILTVQSIGCIVVTVILGLFGERINKINGIVLGLCLMGTAGVLVGLLPKIAPQGGYALMLCFSLLAGLGYITIDLLMNGVVADIFPDKKNILLPFVHAFYGVGAMLAPLFVTSLVKPENSLSFALPYLIIGIASLFLCAVLALVGRRIAPFTPYADMRDVRRMAKGNPAEVFRDKRAWLYLLTCFLYLSFQTGLSTWLPTYCQRQLGMDFAQAGRMVTLYFLGALVMRFLSPLVYKKISVRSFYILSLLCSGVLFLLFLFVSLSPAAVNVVLIAMGLLQGASIPALIILCCDAFPERSASASSIVVLGMCLSSMLIPPLMGALMKGFGPLVPMLVITACLFFSVLPLLPIEKIPPAAVSKKEPG